MLESGFKIRRETDYASADGLFSVERLYRSGGRNFAFQSASETPGFGAHWWGVFPGRLFIYGATTDVAELLPATGGAQRFYAPYNDTSSYAYWTDGISRIKMSVISTPTADRYTYYGVKTTLDGTPEIKLTYPDGSYLMFQRAGYYALPVEQGLANGYRRFFDYNVSGTSYDPLKVVPYRVRDSLGRQMTLTWQSLNWADGSIDGTVPQLTGIGLPDGTKLTYTYDVAKGRQDRLTNVKRLAADNTVLWARAYAYENATYPHALTGVFDQNAARIATYGYGPSGLATSTELAGGVNRYTVDNARDWCCTARRTITNPLGHVETQYWYHDYVGSPLDPKRLDRAEGSASANVPAYLRSYSYYYQLLTGWNDRRGIQTDLVDDGANMRPVRRTVGAGTPEAQTTDLTWHPTLDLPMSEARPGLTISYTYDAKGALLTRTETDTTTQTVPYATNGQARTWTYAWNANGRLASVNGPKAPTGTAPNIKDDKTVFTYDGAGNLLTSTNGLGQVTTFANYDANGRPGTMTDLNGIITTYAYDGLGRTRTVTVKHPTDAAQDAVTSFDYDVEGRVTGITAPLTDKLIFDYDLAGRLTAVRTASGERINYAMNAMGGVTSQAVKRADGSVRETVTRTFDELNRMLTLTLGPGRTRTYAYDAGGNVTQATSARSAATTFAFDALERLKTTVRPGGATMSEGYDVRDNSVAHVDALGLTTSYVRNGFGEVIQEASPDRGTSVFYYDKAGDLIASVDGRGQRVDYTRDVLGRVTRKAPVGVTGQDVAYTWDAGGLAGGSPKGRIGKMVDASGTTSYQYDHRGNLTARAQKIGSSATATLYYAYDLADRVIRIGYPSGRGAQYTRDAKGRVVKVETRATSASAWVALASNIQYEAFGPLRSAVYANGLTLARDWGSDGRLYAQSLKTAGNVAKSSLAWTYDADDNVTGITDLVDATRSLSFVHDARDRLVRTDGNLGGATKRRDFVYDANGNRTAVELRDAVGQATPTTTIPYARVANSNRLMSVDIGANQRTIAYDGRGNTQSETRPAGVSVTATYDAYGRLTGYTRTGDPAQANVYNGMDERVAVTATAGSATTRRYLYDPGGRLIGDYGTSATDVKGEYIWLLPDAANDNPYGTGDGNGGWMPLAVATGSGALHWLTGDRLGKPVLTTDAAGNAVTAATSYASLQYPGQVATLADLVYNKHRDYDPTTGRYIQADPIGLQGGENVYLYAEANPLRWTDPEGLNPAIALRACAQNKACTQVVVNVVTTVVGLFCGPKPCPPCNPPAGTGRYRFDQVPPSKPHHPFLGDHYHIYTMNQDPVSCRCSWSNKVTDQPPPLGAQPW